MNRIVFCGHGGYGSGYKSGLEMIAGKSEKILAVDFCEGESDETLYTKLQVLCGQYPDDGLIFACDMIGGSPYKQAVKVSFKKDTRQVVIGISTLAVLEVLPVLNELPIWELAEKLVEVSHSCICHVNTNELVGEEKRIDEGI